MTLGSLTVSSFMKEVSKIRPSRQRTTCCNRSRISAQEGKYYFPTTSSEFYCLANILFCLLGVKRIIDSLCVCSFHFILLIIVPDEGVVKVMDPGRRSMKSWEDMQACLQRAWKRFTAKTPGLPAELTCEPLNVSTTCLIQREEEEEVCGRRTRGPPPGGLYGRRGEGSGIVFAQRECRVARYG